MKKNDLRLFLVCVLMTGWIAQHSLGWAAPVDAKEVDEAAAEHAVLQDSNTLYMLVGGYTSATVTTGVYVYKFNQETGAIEFVSNAEAQNASYLAISADERFVYVAGENSREPSVVYAFAFDKAAGKLNLMNVEETNGASPCYITLDMDGRFVLTANYTGGNISVFPLQSNGSLQPVTKVFDFEFEGSGPVANRQNKPYLHCAVFSPDRRYLFATDLGSDKIYKFETSGSAPFLTAGAPQSFKVEPGSGPRHLTFHQNGKNAYLINELSGIVTVFNYVNGNLEPVQTIAADPGDGNKASADIHVSPDGKFLYASNRANTNSIAIFRINEADGKLTEVGFQATERAPRNFNISPNGKFLLVANQNSNSIQVFERDVNTGLLKEIESQKISDINRPVCIKWVGI